MMIIVKNLKTTEQLQMYLDHYILFQTNGLYAFLLH